MYGVQVMVQMDHKPLQAVFSKPLGQAPTRLQHMMLLQLQKYDLILQHVPGKEILTADALSTAVLQGDTDTEENVVYGVDPIITIGMDLMTYLKHSTSQVPLIQALLKFTQAHNVHRLQPAVILVHEGCYFPIG